MIEIAGLILGIVGIIFAFETPRRCVVGIFVRGSKMHSDRDLTIPVIDICRRGISVKEIEPNKLLFDIPYCAGKNANAHNVKLRTAVLLCEGPEIKLLAPFGDDFPDGISLTYELGKCITYTLSPLKCEQLPNLYIVIRGTYTSEKNDRIFQVFDVFKFSTTTNSWIRTLGVEDKRIRAFVNEDGSTEAANA
ncbi:hypothetical protein [Pseudoduganella sp. R-43]|uniref:hypothetical protein n=1 Tax=unclassified Pseudoduganella TaxID=2637179 RepID=UPI003CF6CEDF